MRKKKKIFYVDFKKKKKGQKPSKHPSRDRVKWSIEIFLITRMVNTYNGYEENHIFSCLSEKNHLINKTIKEIFVNDEMLFRRYLNASFGQVVRGNSLRGFPSIAIFKDGRKVA